MAEKTPQSCRKVRKCHKKEVLAARRSRWRRPRRPRKLRRRYASRAGWSAARCKQVRGRPGGAWSKVDEGWDEGRGAGGVDGRRVATNRRERGALTVSGGGHCTDIGVFNPYDRALYMMQKHKRPFLVLANFRHPYEGFHQSVLHRIVTGG